MFTYLVLRKKDFPVGQKIRGVWGGTSGGEGKKNGPEKNLRGGGH